MRSYLGWYPIILYDNSCLRILHPRLRIIGKIKNIGKGNLSNTVIKECIDETSDGQRIDNFLFKRYRGVPKSHIYQILRSGQVRVNGKRINAKYRLQLDDIVRIPPIKKIENNVSNRNKITKSQFVNFSTIFEDETLLVIDKPSGMAVHGGSGVSFGVIEQLRIQHPDWKFLELVHRLDRDTSGVILLTRGGAINRYLDTAFKARSIIKHYVAMVDSPNKLAETGVMQNRLDAHGRQKNRMRVVEIGGKSAITNYTAYPENKGRQRVDLTPKTGRTHQLRVHLAYYDAPILGDRLYSDNASDYPRLYLHAYEIILPKSDNFPERRFTAPLPNDFDKY